MMLYSEHDQRQHRRRRAAGSHWSRASSTRPTRPRSPLSRNGDALRTTAQGGVAPLPPTGSMTPRRPAASPHALRGRAGRKASAFGALLPPSSGRARRHGDLRRFTITTGFATLRRRATCGLDAASTFGIMAVAVALLMIGGEFDLSAGVMMAPPAWSPACCDRAGMNIWPRSLALPGSRWRSACSTGGS